MIAQKGIDKVVKFVAIKNGMHSSKGYVYFGKNIKKYAPENLSHIKEVHNSIENYFVT